MPEPDVESLLADPRVIWHEDVLRFSDTDLNGHINNTAFSVFCESGRVNLLRGVLGPAREPGTFFALARIVIEFRAELHFPGRVRSGTWLARIGHTSVTFGQVLIDGDDRLVATSQAVTVSMSGQTRRPVPLGPATRDLAETMLRPDEP